MTAPGVNARAMGETAPASGLPAAGGLDRRARMAKWHEDVKDLQRRIRARRGDRPPVNAATVINELREERIERISSAALGVYDEEEED